MSGAFDRSKAVASTPALTGIAIQTSVSGRPIPVIYGTTRDAPNLLYYTDFKSHQHTTGGKGGGAVFGGAGGKSGAGVTYTYSCTAILGMCEGPIQGFGQAWASKAGTTPSSLGLTAFIGTYPQPPWAYVTSRHPSEARPYSGVAYLAAAPYDLGNSGQLPNHNFEVYGFFSQRTAYQTGIIPGTGAHQILVGQQVWGNGDTHSMFISDLGQVTDSLGNSFTRVTVAPGAGQYAVSNSGAYTFASADAGKTMTIGFTGQGQDADPSLIVTDILTNPHFGVGFPPNRVGELSAVSEIHVLPSGIAGPVPRKRPADIPTPPAIVPVIVRGTQTPWAGAKAAQPNTLQLHVYEPPPAPILVQNVHTPHANSGTTVSGGQKWVAPAPARPTIIEIPQLDNDLTRAANSKPLIVAASFPGSVSSEQQLGQEPGATTNVTVAINQPGTFQDNLSVADSNTNALFTCVASNPGPLQFSFVGGLYTFNAADVGKSVLITYLSLAPLLTFQNYCWAAGIFFSPAYDSQDQASSALDDLTNYSNSEIVASSGAIKVVPRGDTAITANGHTYNPPSVLFDLTDDHFKDQTGTTDPVLITRKRQSDQTNVIQLQYLDRSNAYNPGTVEATDQAMVDAYGRRDSGSQSAALINDSGIARFCAQLLLQKQSIRKNYAFSLSARFAWLDPMDLVTITDTAIETGIQKAVRILDMQESDDGSWDVIAEDYLAGVAHAPAFSVNVGGGFAANYNASPGAVNTPIIYEVPPQIASNGGLEAWIAFSGANALFGGGEVWVSSDGVSPYTLLARRDGQTRMGTTTAPLPVGADPDYANTLSVDISESGALSVLNSGTTLDADQGHTLCLVDAELVGYEFANLTGVGQYDLTTYLRRGMYNTAIAPHLTGAPFARLDDTVAVYAYDKSQIGKTVHVKIRAYNIYGGGLQDLSTCTDYPYTLVGPPACGIVQNFTAAQVGLTVVLSWQDLNDNSVKGYDIFYGPQGGTFAGATMLTEASRTTETTTAQVGAGFWTFYICAHNIADQLGPVSQLNIAINAFQQEFDFSGTWTKPLGVTSTAMALIECWGGGGGGGNAPSIGNRGGGGGGGAYNYVWVPVSLLGATETASVGAGGVVNSAGGNTSFGLWVAGFGGGAGDNNGLGGGGGGGQNSIGINASVNNGGFGGGPAGTAGGIYTGPSGGGALPAASGAGGGAAGDSGGSVGAGGNAYFGGAGGGGGSSTIAGAVGGQALYGGGGGGGSGSSALNGAAGGPSALGGAGGAAGAAGSFPSGGGGGNAAGAGGRIRITVIP